MISILFLPTILCSLFQITHGYEYQSQYTKPFPSNGPCIDSIESLEEASKIYNLKCLGCYEQTQSSCLSTPEIKCQTLIDNIYRNCDKVNLPQRFFFDPPVSVYFERVLMYYCLQFLHFCLKGIYILYIK